MNHITIAGRIGKDMELRHTSGGDAVGTFSVADDQGKDKPTIWWRCQLWGKRSESLKQYLTKGQSVTVTGQVQERDWTDKDGQQRKAQEVRVIDLALQGGKPDQAQAPAPQQAAKPAASPAAQSGFDDMSDDIPF